MQRVDVSPESPKTIEKTRIDCANKNSQKTNTKYALPNCFIVYLALTSKYFPGTTIDDIHNYTKPLLKKILQKYREVL